MHRICVVVGLLLCFFPACDDLIGPSSCEIGRYWHAGDRQCYPQGRTCGDGFVRDPNGPGGCIPEEDR